MILQYRELGIVPEPGGAALGITQWLYLHRGFCTLVLS